MWGKEIGAKFVASGVAAIILLALGHAYAADPSSSPAVEQVVKPELERRTVQAPRIDVDDFEVAAYAGILSVQNFGSEPTFGARLGYHITEDLFVEGTYAVSTVSDQAYYDIGLSIFTQRPADLQTYHLSVGLNLFPGEVFVGKSWASTSAVYLIGGVGNTTLDDRDYTTFNFGFGLRVLTADWFAFRMEMRDLIWQSDLLGTNELKHNFEFTLGASFYF